MAEYEDYYVYVYLDPRKPGAFLYGDFVFDHEPFYVGMGRRNRLYHHMTGTDKKNNIKFFKIKKIVEEYGNPIIIKYRENMTQDDAFGLEKIMIDTVGRCCKNTGPLVNIQEGGRTGGIWDDARRQSLSRSLVGRKLSDEHRAKVKIQMITNNPFKNKQHSEETKSHLSDVRKGTRLGSENTFYGKKHSKETIDKIQKKRSLHQNIKYNNRYTYFIIVNDNRMKLKSITIFKKEYKITNKNIHCRNNRCKLTDVYGNVYNIERELINE